jgi:hypothetical protein
MTDNPLAEEHTERAIEDLNREMPEILVFNLLYHQLPIDHAMIKWVQERYIPLPGNPDRGLYKKKFLFYICIRRDGRLANRLGVLKTQTETN